MRISDWSSDVCSSDLPRFARTEPEPAMACRANAARGVQYRKAPMHRLLMLAALLLAAPAAAENSAPQPLPFEDAIPPARDLAFPGTITMKADPRDVQQAIFLTRTTIPAAAEI